MPYDIRKVTLERIDENDGWMWSESGEWQITETESGRIALRIPWTFSRDNTEWPEREFYHGPTRIDLNPDAQSVTCYFSMEHIHGFKFEDSSKEQYHEIVPIPDAEDDPKT